MKRSANVMLSAVFLSAIATANAKAQVVHAPDTTGVKDTVTDSNAIVSYNDGQPMYDDTTAVYQEAAPPYYGGFFRFQWVWNWRGYHRYHHYRHRHPAENTTNGPRTATHGNGFKTTTAPSPAVAANGTRSNGFGNTMHTTHSSAHS